MLHQFDANAIAHQKQLDEQYFQQQQHQHQQQQQQQQLQQLHASTASDTLDSQSSTPSQGPSGFIQERYGGTANNANNSNIVNNHAQPTPFIGNPTILASQDQELHPHLVPRSSQQQQQQQHHHHHQQQSHLYNGNPQDGERLQQLQEIENMMIKGPPFDFDSVFQRKRSLSVPMLFAQQQQQSNGSPSGSTATSTADSEAIAAARAAAVAAAAAAAAAATAATVSRENDNVDHDMETDITDIHKPMRLFRRSDMMRQLMKEQQEASTRVLKSHHNTRIRHYPGYQSLYYSHNNHHSHNNHYTLRHHLHYNPHSYRKFPPYQYWAASAQRNYHLATIGVLPSPATSTSEISAYAESARNDFLVYAESAILALAGGRPPPGVGDRILRTSIRNGGVSKSTSSSSSSSSSAYPSRLPVHFRHMTSRTNRRPAICVNPLQVEQQQLQQQQQHNREAATTKAGSAATAISGVLPLFSGLSIEESQSDLASAGSNNRDSSSSSTRKRLTEWKRVTAFNLDLDGDLKRGSGNDLVSTPTSSASGKSSSAKSSSGIGGRHWMNQPGGLANLLQARQSQDGGASGAGTVDRLVEEMNKWSV
ncbi:hypothetical protein BGX26_007566 [Mortierella sp. AD094]|nr:hypothetical protein BGX26_007566 [Mortierella sp. AD094]